MKKEGQVKNLFIFFFILVSLCVFIVAVNYTDNISINSNVVNGEDLMPVEEEAYENIIADNASINNSVVLENESLIIVEENASINNSVVLENESLIPIEENTYLEDNPQTPKIHGYIIQFKDEPILVKKVRLDKLEKIGLVNKAEVSSSLKNYESDVLEIHSLAKTEFKKEINELKILGEYKSVFNGIALNITEEEALMLKEKFDFVKEIYPNYYVKVILLQDSVPLINADDVWGLQDGNGNNITGVNITVAVIDTGVDYSHSDLGGCFGSGCRVKGGWDFAYNDFDPMDVVGHGTHVAGIVGANGSIKGVAPDVEFLAYKVLDDLGGGTPAITMLGIENATNSGVDIITMSLGGWPERHPDDPLAKAVDIAVESGVVFVVSAGNCGPTGSQMQCPYGIGDWDTVVNPALARKALTIGASYKTDGVTGFSSRGPTPIGTLKPDVVAPGAYINSTCSRGGEYCEKSGTSMSAPMVAGAVALILQKHPDWTPDEIKMALRNTAIDIGENHITQGYGRIDVLAAIQLDYVFPIALFNGTSSSTYEVSGNINITGIATADNLSNYTVEVGRGFEPSIWIEINSSSQSIEEGLLAEWDTTGGYDGINTVRLIVKDNESRASEDRLTLDLDNMHITTPFNNYAFYKEDIINISGTVRGGNFEKYVISYKDDLLNSTWIEINSSSQSVEEGLLAELNISSLSVGFYYINLSIYYPGGYMVTEIIRIYAGEGMLEGWPVKVNESFHLYKSSLIVEDLDDNGLKELFSISYDGLFHTEMNLFYPNGTNFGGWPKRFNNDDSPSSSPAIEDIDSDGELEIIYTNHQQGSTPYLKAMKIDGTLIEWKLANFPELYKMGPVVIGDLDKNGIMDFVTGNRAWHSNHSEFSGSPIWESYFPYYSFGSALGDLDNDGDLEIVSTYDEELYVWDPIEGNMSGWPKTTFLDPYRMKTDTIKWPVLGDLDNDGDLEIIVGDSNSYEIGNASFYVFNYNGTNFGGWPKEIEDAWFNTPPALGDLDNDGDLEIVATSSGGAVYKGMAPYNVFVWHNNGTNFAGWPKEVNSYASGPVLADVDGDSKQEIIVQTDEGKIYIWNEDGTNVEGWPKGIPERITEEEPFNERKHPSVPIVVDFDNDGDTEIIISVNNEIFIWDLNSTYNEENNEWPQFQHDRRNTGLHGNKLYAPLDFYKFYIKDSSGNPVAWLGDLGNIVLKGTCFSGGSCDSPGDNSFIIKNSANQNVAFINSTGDLCLESGDCSDESVTCNPTTDALIIRDSSNTNMSYIDTDGDLCLTGKLFENIILS